VTPAIATTFRTSSSENAVVSRTLSKIRAGTTDTTPRNATPLMIDCAIASM
jgi:hypothetical protein